MRQFGFLVRTTEWFRLEATFKGLLVQPPCNKWGTFSWIRLLIALSNLTLSGSRNRASATPEGNKFQCFTTLIIKVCSHYCLLSTCTLFWSLHVRCMFINWRRIQRKLFLFFFLPVSCHNLWVSQNIVLTEDSFRVSLYRGKETGCILAGTENSCYLFPRQEVDAIYLFLLTIYKKVSNS